MAEGLEFRYSGGTSNKDPLKSIGGAMSTTPIITDKKDNLFETFPDNRTGNEKEYTDYRSLYVVNLYTDRVCRDTKIELYSSSAYNSEVSLGTLSRNEIQKITFTNPSNISGGGFVLWHKTTPTITINWSANQETLRLNIEAALRGVEDLQSTTVAVDDIDLPAMSYKIEFKSESKNKKLALLTPVDSLTKTGPASISISSIQKGSPINSKASQTGFTTITPRNIDFVVDEQISIGDLLPGEYFYVWIKRHASILRKGSDSPLPVDSLEIKAYASVH